jgi:hypothetical protein
MSIICLGFVAANSGTTGAAGVPDADAPPIVQQFLSRSEIPLVRYEAVRRLEAMTRRGSMRGWIHACTELTEAGFRYAVLDEGGSGVIRRRVLLASLDEEQRIRQTKEIGRAALHPVNYAFLDSNEESSGLSRIAVEPLREDVMLLKGAMFLDPVDADLVRVEGVLSKPPSFWTRRVHVIRRYARIANVRVPMSMESTADVLVAGNSSFSMTYDYYSVNGENVGGRVPFAEVCEKAARRSQ